MFLNRSSSKQIRSSNASSQNDSKQEFRKDLLKFPIEYIHIDNTGEVFSDTAKLRFDDHVLICFSGEIKSLIPLILTMHSQEKKASASGLCSTKTSRESNTFISEAKNICFIIFSG